MLLLKLKADGLAPVSQKPFKVQGSGYKILIINTTFYFKKQLQWSTVCDVVRKKTHFSIYKYKLDSTAQW